MKKSYDHIATRSLKLYQSKKADYLQNIRKMTNKGYYEILLLMKDNQSIRYGDLSGYVIQNRLASESYFLKSLNDLYEMNLIQRKTLQTKPTGTSYCITKKGSNTIRKMEDLAKYLMDE